MQRHAENATRLLRALLLATALTAAPAAQAQQWGGRWIRCQQPHAAQGVWFRNTFTAGGKPAWARLRVATAGMMDVLVNSRNVSRDCPTENVTGIVEADYDISGFMRPDSNTIAIEYFPTHDGEASAEVSAVCYGQWADGTPFAIPTDATWLCRPSARRLNSDLTETLDGTAYPYVWHATGEDEFPQALWTTAAEAASPPEAASKDGDAPSADSVNPTPYPLRIRQQRYIDIAGDSVFYEFGTAFRGFVRITLRDARPGEVVCYDDNRYVCNGTMDEQAFTKFVVHDYRRVLVSGSKGFDRSQIQKIEAIETAPRRYDYTKGFRH